MGKAWYIGDANYLARKMKKMYIGGADYKAHKAKKIYIGGADGKAHLSWISEVPAGEVIFTSSQVWTVPDGVSVVDVFLVGGGASGDSRYRTASNEYNAGGGGGSSGFTKTYANVSVTPNSQISVVVGSGGASVSKGQWAKGGGASSFGSYVADGCAGGTTSPTWSGGQYMSQGGSGGGSYGYYISGYKYGGAGGSDGGKGKGPSTDSRVIISGQGTTTRAWGDTAGTLYAGGGGGGSVDGTYAPAVGGDGGGGAGGSGSILGTAGTPNTGGGGGGAGYYSTSGAGGSGLVIVRWKAQ